MEKICSACGKPYNKPNKKYCSAECFKASPRQWTKYKESDNSDTSYIKINSPEFAYALGFLWGDGYLREKKCRRYCLHYPVVHIIREDFESIKYCFRALGKWKVRFIKPRKRQPKEQVMSILYDKSMGKFLFDNDYKIKSQASPTKILSNIPDRLRHYWWRGFFDADGCFYISKDKKCIQFSFAGSFDQDWSATSILLTELNVKYKASKREVKTGRSSDVKGSGVFNVSKLGEYLYQGSLTPKLTRKYEKFLKIRELAQIAGEKSMNKGRSGNYFKQAA